MQIRQCQPVRRGLLPALLLDKKTSVVDPEHMERLGTFVCSYLQVPARAGAARAGCGLRHRPVAAHGAAAVSPAAATTAWSSAAYLCERFGWERGSVVDYPASEPFDLGDLPGRAALPEPGRCEAGAAQPGPPLAKARCTWRPFRARTTSTDIIDEDLTGQPRVPPPRRAVPAQACAKALRSWAAACGSAAEAEVPMFAPGACAVADEPSSPAPGTAPVHPPPPVAPPCAPRGWRAAPSPSWPVAARAASAAPAAAWPPATACAACAPRCPRRAGVCLMMADIEPLKPSNTGWLIADVVADTFAFGWGAHRGRSGPAGAAGRPAVAAVPGVSGGVCRAAGGGGEQTHARGVAGPRPTRMVGRERDAERVIHALPKPTGPRTLASARCSSCWTPPGPRRARCSAKAPTSTSFRC